VSDGHGKLIAFPGVDPDKLPKFEIDELDKAIESPMQVENRYAHGCPDWHRRGIKLNQVNRRIYCKTCGEELDMFEYIEQLARDWAWTTSTHRSAVEKRKVAEKRLDEVLRQERNAKARLKNAKRRLAQTGTEA
jgi:hypothetical protein